MINNEVQESTVTTRQTDEIFKKSTEYSNVRIEGAKQMAGKL
jgi:hypothetical protein